VLTEADATALVERLSFTIRGLDIHAGRPNAVVMLTGPAAARAADVARIVARHLYGSDLRIIPIDFGRLTDDTGLKTLLGSPPSYVGYADRHALDAVVDSPWSVVLCQRIDLAHESVRAVFAPALVDGNVTDFRGRRIRFSDTVVLLTAQGEAIDARPRIGFAASDLGSNQGQSRSSYESSDVADLMPGIDLTISTLPAESAATSLGAERELLDAVNARFQGNGVVIEWDATVVAWLTDLLRQHADRRPVIQTIEREVLPQLVKQMPQARTDSVMHLRVDRRGLEITVGLITSTS
jgi:ATP-dependent Clp protease ATP-binding subunit ClpA